MKKLRFFGLLVTVVLLAFGLTIGCNNGTTDTPEGGTTPLVYRGTSSGGEVVVTFDSAPGATEPGPGDSYTITVGGQPASSGRIELLDSGVIKFRDSGGAEFDGQLTGSTLNIINIPNPSGGSPLNVAATRVGGSGTNNPGGGGTGGTVIGGGTPPTGSTTGLIQLARIEAVDTDTDGTLTTEELEIEFFTFVGGLDYADVKIEAAGGFAEIDKTVPPVSDGSTEQNVWMFTLDLTTMRTGYVTVWVDKAGVDSTKRTVAVVNELVAPYALTDGAGGAEPITTEFDNTTATENYFEETTAAIVFLALDADVKFVETDITINKVNGPFGVTAFTTGPLQTDTTAGLTTYIIPITNITRQGPIEVILKKAGLVTRVFPLVVTQKGFIKVNSIKAVDGRSGNALTTTLRAVFDAPPEILNAGDATGTYALDLRRGLNYGETGNLDSIANGATLGSTPKKIDPLTYEFDIPAGSDVIREGIVNLYFHTDYIGVADAATNFTNSDIYDAQKDVAVYRQERATVSAVAIPATGLTTKIGVTLSRPVYDIAGLVIGDIVTIHNGASAAALSNPVVSSYSYFELDVSAPTNRGTLTLRIDNNKNISDAPFEVVVSNAAGTPATLPTATVPAVTATVQNAASGALSLPTPLNIADNTALPAATSIATITLSVPAGYGTYQWQTSTDGYTWTNSADVARTTANLFGGLAADQTYYYRCVVTTSPAGANPATAVAISAPFPIMVTGTGTW